MLEQALHDRPGHVGGNREADALITTGAGEDRGVDPDQLALHVDQRTARVARVDRGVGLDEVLVVGDADVGPALGRDDPHRHRLPHSERVADGEHHVSQPQPPGVSQGQRVQVLGLALQPQHREIRLGIGAHHLGLQLAVVGEGHADLVGVLDHVVVGQHDAVCGDDHARAQALLPALARHAVERELSAEEVLEEWVAKEGPARWLLTQGAGGRDVDHRGQRRLRHVGHGDALAPRAGTGVGEARLRQQPREPALGGLVVEA